MEILVFDYKSPILLINSELKKIICLVLIFLSTFIFFSLNANIKLSVFFFYEAILLKNLEANFQIFIL